MNDYSARKNELLRSGDKINSEQIVEKFNSSYYMNKYFIN